MAVNIYQADLAKDKAKVYKIFGEYLQWAVSRVNDIYQLGIEFRPMLEDDMLTLEKFMPPKGRLLLIDGDPGPVAMACMRDLGEGIGEIKRMYVQPLHRRQGLASALVNKLLAEANEIGYRCIRLDSAKFMAEAHHLYRSFGFVEIPPYRGSEIPSDFQVHWIFMEKQLSFP